ncbi:MAG: RDD family protein [Steroidobacteraceae bacterium]
MAAEELSVRGLTGVDMTLRVAGPGTRSYAFVVDWHFRVLAALVWILAGLAARLLFRHERLAPLGAPLFVLAVFAPAALIYFLYHPVLELAMRGRTPGKRIAGARIVTREGSLPGTGALIVRNLFRVVDSLPLCYVVGLVCCLATLERVRLGDLVAGTVLVLEEAPASLARLGGLLERGAGAPEALVLVDDLLARWPELAAERRIALARAVLSRLDPEFVQAGTARLGEQALKERLQALVRDGSR